VIPAAAVADSTPTATPGRTPLDRARVIVVGGGVTGLAAAYQLAKRGAKVTLVEKAPAIGKGAGGSSPGYLFHSGDAAAAAAAVDAVGVVFPPPGFATGFGPVSLVRYLKGNLEKVLHGGITQAETPLPPIERGVMPWLGNFFSLNLSRRDWVPRRWEAIGALITRSREDLRSLMAEENLAFKINDLGLLTVCHTKGQLDSLTAPLLLQGNLVSGVEIVEQEAALSLEPGMIGSTKEDIWAGIYTRNFASGDPDSFAVTLAAGTSTTCRSSPQLRLLAW